MRPAAYTDSQQRIAKIPISGSIFLEGVAGTGKTTCGINRLENLLTEFPGYQILVMAPQRSLGNPYIEYLQQRQSHSGSFPSILTLGGLARRMVNLFWPLVSPEVGFLHPNQPPQFLSIETAQYCMERAIAPFLDQGFFQTVILSRNRLYGQILDDLNKSAILQFPIDEISQRLKSVRNLDPGLSIAYDQVLICAKEFRKYCLSNNLLDFSLLVEVLINNLWKKEIFKEYFYKNFRVLIVDNVEEDVPAAHDLIKEWIPNLDSALIIFDHDGGYRSFLGADPISAASIKQHCSRSEVFDIKIGYNETISNFSTALNECISHKRNTLTDLGFSEVLKINNYRFYPEMITEVCAQVKELIVSKEVEPGEIAILSPYLSDALNFTLSTGLNSLGIPFRSSRPSQTYINDPKVRAFFTLTKMAHPQWQLQISFHELRNALMVILPGLDVVKADLIVKTLFSVKQPHEGLRSFDIITNPMMQERISFQVGEKLERIRNWIEEYKLSNPAPLDVFFSMLFGEVFSQKGFSFFTDHSAATRIFQVTQSIRTFRQFLTQVMGTDDISASLEYLRSVESGLLPSAIFTNEEKIKNSLVIAPAHSFLMENRKVNYQFWLDIGSLGWWERLNQPLTNPYLLNRNRHQGEIWTEAHEFDANQAGMRKIVAGLINRCGKIIFVNTVHTNEYGSEQRGPLLQAFHTLEKRVFQFKGSSSV